MAWPLLSTGTGAALTWALVFLSLAFHAIQGSVVLHRMTRMRSISHYSPSSRASPSPMRFIDSLTHIISVECLLPLIFVASTSPCGVCQLANPTATFLSVIVVLLRPLYVTGAAVDALLRGIGQQQCTACGPDRQLHLFLVTSSVVLLLALPLASSALFSYTAQQAVLLTLLFLALLVNTACLVALMVVLQLSRSRESAEGTAPAATSNSRPTRIIDSRNTTSTTTITSTTSFSSSSSMLVTPRRVQAAARSEFEVMMQQARRASGLVPPQQPSFQQAQAQPQPQLRCTITPLPPGTAAKLHDAFVHSSGGNGSGAQHEHETYDDPFGFLKALALAASHDPASTQAIDEAMTRLYFCLASQWLACATAVPWLLYPLFAPGGQAGTPMPRGLFLLFACGAALSSLLPTIHALLSRDRPTPEVAPLRPQPRRSTSAPLGATHWQRAASATLKSRVASLRSLWGEAGRATFKTDSQQEELPEHAQQLESTNDNSIVIHPASSSGTTSFSSITLLSSPGQGRNEHHPQSATPFASPARVPGAYAHPALLSFSTLGDASSSGLGLQGKEVSEAVLLPPISAGTSLGNSFVYHDAEISTYQQHFSAAAAVEEEQQQDAQIDEQDGEAWHSFAAAEPEVDEDADEGFGLVQDLRLDGAEELQGLEFSHPGQAAAALPAEPAQETLIKPVSRAPPTIPTSQAIFLLSPPRPTEPPSHFSSPTASSPGMTSVSYSTSFSVLSDRKRQGSPARQQQGQEQALEQEREKPLCSSPVRGRSSGRGRGEEEVVVVEEGVVEKVGSSFISLQTIAAVTSCCEVEEKEQVTRASPQDLNDHVVAQEEEHGVYLPQSSATSRSAAPDEEEEAVQKEKATMALEPSPLASARVSSLVQRPATALSHRHSVPLPAVLTTTPGCSAERPTLCSTLGLGSRTRAPTPSSASQALRRRRVGSELGLRSNDAPFYQPSSKPASATKSTATQGQGIQTSSTPPAAAAAAAAADCTLSSFTSSLLLSPDVSPDKCEGAILAAVLAPLSPELDHDSSSHEPVMDQADDGEESGPVRLDLRGLTPLQLHAYKWPHGNLSTVAEQSEEFREGVGSDVGSQHAEEVDVAGTATLTQVSQCDDGGSGCQHASEEAWLGQEGLDATMAGNEVWPGQNSLDATVAGNVDANYEAARSSFVGAAPFHSSATPYRTASHDHDLSSLSPFTLAEETMECLLNTSAAAAAAAATAASCVRMTPLDYGLAPPLPPTSPLSLSSSSYEFVHPPVTSPERRNSLLVSNTPPARYHQQRGRRSLLLAEKLGAKRRPRSVSGLLGIGGGGSSSKRPTLNKDTIGLPLCNVAAAERNQGEKLLPELPGEACNPALFYGNDSLLLQNAQTVPAAPGAPLPPPPPTAWRATEDSMDDRIATAVETQYGAPDPAPAGCDTSATSTAVAGSVVIRSIKRKAVPSQQQQQQRLSAAALSSPPSTMTNARRAAKSRSLPPPQLVPITPARTEELRSYAQADAGLQVAIDAALRGGCPSTLARARSGKEQDENAPPVAGRKRERSSMPPLRPQRPRRPLEPFVPTTNASTSSAATSSGKGKAPLRPATGLLPLAQARAPRAPMPRRHIVSVAPECLRKNGGWI